MTVQKNNTLLELSSYDFSEALELFPLIKEEVVILFKKAFNLQGKL